MKSIILITKLNGVEDNVLLFHGENAVEKAQKAFVKKVREMGEEKMTDEEIISQHFDYQEFYGDTYTIEVITPNEVITC